MLNFLMLQDEVNTDAQINFTTNRKSATDLMNSQESKPTFYRGLLNEEQI
jgi:hypothetical protein